MGWIIFLLWPPPPAEAVVTDCTGSFRLQNTRRAPADKIGRYPTGFL